MVPEERLSEEESLWRRAEVHYRRSPTERKGPAADIDAIDAPKKLGRLLEGWVLLHYQNIPSADVSAIVNDVLYRMERGKYKQRKPGSFKAWVYTITKTVAVLR